MTKEELQQAVKVAEQKLAAANQALQAFLTAPENNVFENLEDGALSVHGALESQANLDCEGSHNCGLEVYEQEFIVDGIHYLGKLTCQYNRHDKTYYYLDESEFTYEPVDRDGA